MDDTPAEPAKLPSPATHQGVVLHEVPFLCHQQGPKRRLARLDLAPHKPPKPYQREEQHVDSIHQPQDWPRKKQDQQEPANHLILEPHWGARLHASSFHRDLKTPWKHLPQWESVPYSLLGPR
ncbi:hypothetical protein E2C01_073342 [Portunus trituberculatus]|uniref:Uncharacterized protein n=1 Tax=Portunus trituberculatus TaxID=210409 RepID=A0A5B7IDQ5_PORTR|nr:hypothetical protein [Portunus trituberculatus]